MELNSCLLLLRKEKRIIMKYNRTEVEKTYVKGSFLKDFTAYVGILYSFSLRRFGLLVKVWVKFQDLRDYQ